MFTFGIVAAIFVLVAATELSTSFRSDGPMLMTSQNGEDTETIDIKSNMNIEYNAMMIYTKTCS